MSESANRSAHADEDAVEPTPTNPRLVVSVEADRGRWWVVFEVTRAGLVDAPPTVIRRRIQSFARERQAHVAARWMRAAAERPSLPNF
jgi:hypothetical protein